MKRIIFLILTLISLHSAAASSCLSFCENGKTWHTDDVGIEIWLWTIHDYSLSGDTIIDGKTCLKMYKDTHYRGAYFDERNCTYCILPNSTEPHLVYNFDIEYGDIVNTYSPLLGTTMELTVDSVYSKVFEGIQRRVIKLSQENSENLITWIEGIGCTVSPEESFFDTTTATSSYATALRRCFINDQTLYSSEPDKLPFGYNGADGFGGETIHLPFCQKEKRWLVEKSYPQQNKEPDIMVYTLSRDTIIGCNSALCMYCDDDYLGAFFDEGYHTYYIAPDQTEPRLFYNFCLWEWDCTRVFNGKNWGTLACCLAGPYFSKGRNRSDMRYLDLEQDKASEIYSTSELLKKDAGTWFEGVGSLYGPMYNWISPLDDSGVSQTLLACWIPNEIIYDPQNIVGIQNTRISKSGKHTFYNLSGRRTSNSTYQSGIYIKDGKKVIR